MLTLGQRLEDYVVVSLLNEGGQGSVYLGRHPGTDEYVAIKVLKQHAGDDAKLDLEDEAAIRIDHPNVVRLVRMGQHQKCPYLIMEFLHGCSLADLLETMGRRQRAMRPDIALYIAHQVAMGLHAAHELRDPEGKPLNLVHRDVTPQNIFLTVSGAVKLIDFGIAKVRGRGGRTEKGMIRGKLRYLAPEQATGRKLDRRTDIYALGIVLWEMLTMKQYVEGDTYEEMTRWIVQPTPYPPSQYAPGIEPEVDALVLRALEPKVDSRPRSAAEWMSSVQPNASRQHVSELLRVFTRDTIVEMTRILPEDVGSQIAQHAKTVSFLPGEDAATTRISDQTRQEILSHQQESRLNADTWRDLEPRHAEIAGALRAKREKRARSDDPTMLMPRRHERLSAKTRAALVILAAFVFGALFAFVYVQLR